jgi:hypothetical protein
LYPPTCVWRSTDRNIGGREDESVFDVIVVCRNIFDKTKYREKTFERRAGLISIFLFKGCDISIAGAKCYFACYSREK